MNSILKPQSQPQQQINMQQLQQFARNFKGNPKQQVMQLLQSGQMSNPQFQQLVQTAKQITGFLK